MAAQGRVAGNTAMMAGAVASGVAETLLLAHRRVAARAAAANEAREYLDVSLWPDSIHGACDDPAFIAHEAPAGSLRRSLLGGMHEARRP